MARMDGRLSQVHLCFSWQWYFHVFCEKVQETYSIKAVPLALRGPVQITMFIFFLQILKCCLIREAFPEHLKYKIAPSHLMLPLSLSVPHTLFTFLIAASPPDIFCVYV